MYGMYSNILVRQCCLLNKLGLTVNVLLKNDGERSEKCLLKRIQGVRRYGECEPTQRQSVLKLHNNMMEKAHTG